MADRREHLFVPVMFDVSVIHQILRDPVQKVPQGHALVCATEIPGLRSDRCEAQVRQGCRRQFPLRKFSCCDVEN